MSKNLGIRKNLERTDLSQVVPLQTPFVIFIDPCSACNFKCTFCPTGDLSLMKEIGRYQGVLKIEDFAKILQDINEFPGSIKVLRLYKDGEPLLNKNFPEMVRMAKKHPKIEAVDTTTNGALLTKKLSLELIEAGIDRINISIDGLDADQILKFTGAKINYENFIEQIKFLYENRKGCEIVIKTTKEIVGDDRVDEFYNLFGAFADKIFAENTSPCWPDFDVEDRMGIQIKEGLYGNEIREAMACPYIFYSLSVNSDMKVSACFVDWSRELTIGDLRAGSLTEIWNGSVLNAHRLAHLEGRRSSHKVCGNCGQISHCGPDNIDKDITRISENFLNAGYFDDIDQAEYRKYFGKTIKIHT